MLQPATYFHQLLTHSTLPLALCTAACMGVYQLNDTHPLAPVCYLCLLSSTASSPLASYPGCLYISHINSLGMSW